MEHSEDLEGLGNEGLGNLGSLLFGLGGGGEKSAGTTDEEYDRLQQLLVSPEVVELQEQMAKVEQRLSNLEHQQFDPQELVKLMLPVISQLLSRQLAEFKAELLAQIEEIVDRAIESEHQKQDSLSIRVIGVQKTGNSHQSSDYRSVDE
jgi:hypothetical protein